MYRRHGNLEAFESLLEIYILKGRQSKCMWFPSCTSLPSLHRVRKKKAFNPCSRNEIHKTKIECKGLYIDIISAAVEAFSETKETL